MPPTTINAPLSLEEIDRQMRAYGKPEGNQFITLDDVTESSTNFLNNGTAVPTAMSFFQTGTSTDTTFNTATLPYVEFACDIIAVSLRSNLELAGASPLGIKADYVFWSQSWLTIQYRSRATRVKLNGADLIDRTILYASGATPTAAFKPSSQRQDTWTYLQEPVRVGPAQNLTFSMSFPTGYTSLAYAAGTSAQIPNRSLTDNSGAFFQLRLKIVKKGASQQ